MQALTQSISMQTLCSDTLSLVFRSLSDADAWSMRSVSKAFAAQSKERDYNLKSFLKYETCLNDMTPHKGMWRRARREGCQSQLASKLTYNLLEHAAADVSDLIQQDRIHEFTTWDLATLDENTVRIDVNLPIALYLLNFAKIPRLQRKALPKVSTTSNYHITYHELVQACAYFQNSYPLQQFLDLHDSYFAFQWHISQVHPFFRQCKTASMQHPPLYPIATMKKRTSSTLNTAKRHCTHEKPYCESAYSSCNEES
jgi:hypothetical protein